MRLAAATSDWLVMSSPTTRASRRARSASTGRHISARQSNQSGKGGANLNRPAVKTHRFRILFSALIVVAAAGLALFPKLHGYLDEAKRLDSQASSVEAAAREQQ